MVNLKRLQVIEIMIICSLIFIIAYFSYPFYMSFHKDKNNDLLQYKIVDVIKYQGKIRPIAHFNDHYFILIKNYDNVIYKHYEKCPNCSKSFHPFIFSIYDGYDTEIRKKEHRLKLENN